MTVREPAGEGSDAGVARVAREARIAELERQLFGRPVSGAGTADANATNPDRSAALEELERLRTPPAEPAVTPTLEQVVGPEPVVGPEQSLQPGRPIPPHESARRSDSSTPERPRGPLRLLAALGIAAVVAGTLVGILTAPPVPAALDTFRSPATAVESVRSAILRDAGLPLLADGRIVTSTSSAASLLAFRAPQGTAKLLRDADASLVGNELSPFGGALYILPAPTALDRADTRRSEVCAWVVERSFAIEGRCTTLEEFAQEGLVFETERFGIRYAVAWSPAGEAELRALPAESGEP